jgi:hypothetical protein
MLKGIRDFFEQHLAAPGAKPRHTLELATATLVAEVARLDGGIDARERSAVLDALKARFALTDPEAASLVDLAEAESREATPGDRRADVARGLRGCAPLRPRAARDPQGRRSPLRPARRVHRRQNAGEGGRRGIISRFAGEMPEWLKGAPC